MTRLVRRRALLAFALALPLVGACNRELQDDVGVFLDALAHDDYPKFLTIAGTELATEVDEAEFHDMAATYAKLGPEQDRTRTGIAVRNGWYSVDYTLTHTRGDVYLVATSDEDKLDGFELSGAWKLAFAARTHDAVTAIITAVEADDRAALRALFQPVVDDAFIDRLLTELRPLGPHTAITPIDDKPQEYHVKYANASILLGVNLRGPQISAVRYHSE